MFKNALIQTKIGQLSTFHRSGNPTFVFLSGIGNFPTKENFATVIEKLPAQVGVLTIDFPNVGDSSLTNQAEYTLDEWGQAFVSILELYKVTDYILIVHNISGLLALELIQTVGNCHGFIGIEPSTRAIMSEQIHYPEFTKVEEMISTVGFETYLQAISKRGMNKAQHQALWDGFYQSVAKWEAVSDEAFVFYPTLE
ncbi:alpha/beta hydrolase [Streptococcus sp. X16XC17]|uniref:alpha/beta fold hydrolase n=1 Tax=unclassified Streptococcus TaxID=2608887 RepID=UPI00066FBD3D|nr:MULTISPECIES: alpha/beta hydrolase [unclassified Streptococcus]TCD46383.1 alpha/beta hydrolase [Streptococcus sp. X16XC17]